MTTVEAHAMFAAVPVERIPDTLRYLPVVPGVEGRLLWPSFMTAAVKLAGRLDDAESGIDLEGGIAAFHAMVRRGEVGLDAWRDEALQIVAELVQWGDEFDSRLTAIAESN